MQDGHINGQTLNPEVEGPVGELWGRRGLVEPRPAVVPWLQLGPRQRPLDLHDPAPEEVVGGAVEVSLSLEVQSHLEPARGTVVPGLEVGLGVAVVELEEATGS